MTDRRTITLCTGYTVSRRKKGWQEHLQMALIGELFVSGEGGWDERTDALVVELQRVCREYGLSSYAWLTTTLSVLRELVGIAESSGEAIEDTYAGRLN